MRLIDHFIAGGPAGPGARTGDVFDPNVGNVQARVALGDAAVLELAVQAAAAAQPRWAAVNPQRRARTGSAGAQHNEIAIAHGASNRQARSR